jgi:hypothetical protein
MALTHFRVCQKSALSSSRSRTYALQRRESARMCVVRVDLFLPGEMNGLYYRRPGGSLSDIPN